MKEFLYGFCEALARRTGYDALYLFDLYLEYADERDDGESMEEMLVDFITITLEEDWDLKPAESVKAYA